GRRPRVQWVRVPVPTVKVANNADGLGVRSPDREYDTSDTVDFSGMGAELLVDPNMCAFVEEVEIEIGEQAWRCAGARDGGLRHWYPHCLTWHGPCRPRV